MKLPTKDKSTKEYAEYARMLKRALSRKWQDAFNPYIGREAYSGAPIDDSWWKGDDVQTDEGEDHGKD